MWCFELISGHRYDEIRVACVTRLVSALQNDTAEKTTWTKVCEITDGHFRGDIKHVTEALSLLWKTLNQDGDATLPPNAGHPVRLFPTHIAVSDRSLSSGQPPSIKTTANWNTLRSAIARSIDEGTFFDRKYLVRHSRNGSRLKAIYFSSVIAVNGLEACEFCCRCECADL